MKFNVSASRAILNGICGKNIIHILISYGPDWFRRRGLMVMNGSHIIIGTPDEVERLKFAERRVIGWVEL